MARRDKFIRLAALIILCGMVWYFSFDQGRLAQQAKVDRMNATLTAKDRTLEGLAQELRKAKARLDECQNASPQEPPPDPSSAGQGDVRINIRNKATRTLFDGRVVIACLEIDPDRRKALIQINKVGEGAPVRREMVLGHSLPLILGDVGYALILERVQASFITLQVVQR